MRFQTLANLTVRTHARSTNPALILFAAIGDSIDSHFNDNLHVIS
jgi:hypothetical protein